jgi:hypothetical protein
VPYNRQTPQNHSKKKRLATYNLAQLATKKPATHEIRYPAPHQNTVAAINTTAKQIVLINFSFATLTPSKNMDFLVVAMLTVTFAAGRAS